MDLQEEIRLFTELCFGVIITKADFLTRLYEIIEKSCEEQKGICLDRVYKSFNHNPPSDIFSEHPDIITNSPLPKFKLDD